MDMLDGPFPMNTNNFIMISYKFNVMVGDKVNEIVHLGSVFGRSGTSSI